jgi:hypothetical protein
LRDAKTGKRAPGGLGADYAPDAQPDADEDIVDTRLTRSASAGPLLTRRRASTESLNAPSVVSAAGPSLSGSVPYSYYVTPRSADAQPRSRSRSPSGGWFKGLSRPFPGAPPASQADPFADRAREREAQRALQRALESVDRLGRRVRELEARNEELSKSGSDEAIARVTAAACGHAAREGLARGLHYFGIPAVRRCEAFSARQAQLAKQLEAQTRRLGGAAAPVAAEIGAVATALTSDSAALVGELSASLDDALACADSDSAYARVEEVTRHVVVGDKADSASDE